MKFLFYFLFFIIVSCFPAFAQDDGLSPKGVKDVSAFASLPILDHGRVKPMDTFARSLLLQLSGRTAFKKESASHWLARHVFAPYSTEHDEIFLINHPDIPKALGIEPRKKQRRFSFAQIQGAFDKLTELARKADAIEPKDRDAVESELIRLYNNLKTYSEISLTFSFVFPHEDFTVNSIGLKKSLQLPTRQGNRYAFIDLALNAHILDQEMRPLEQLPMQQWNERQTEVARLVTHLFDWSRSYRGLPFQIIPAKDTVGPWQSPWDAMDWGLKDVDGRREITAMRDMTLAFWKADQTAFNLAAKTFRGSLSPRVKAQDSGWAGKISLELLFNRMQPFFWAKVFYLLVFFVFLIGLVVRHPNVYRMAWALLWIGFALNTLGVVARMIILERPPVSNLYETFIFVSWVSVASGLLIEKFNKEWLGLVIGSIAGVIFLWIASKFAMEGDTMQMLIAVLNSNFWLSTHVLTITIGYSGMCVAGIIGHIYIIQLIQDKNNHQRLKKTYNALLGTLGFGLTMTFLGTNLGGIWADQSWGRFWGWDPKENGALMIVLWGAILFHARLGGMIRELGMAVGAILGIIIVMWAWFGVNLLSVGLHSYGFTSGLATNLLVYCAAQIIFLLVGWGFIQKNNLKNSH